MKRLKIPQKLVYEKNFTYTKKFSIHENDAVNLSKIYFLKNTKKTCKPNNRDVNRIELEKYKKLNIYERSVFDFIANTFSSLALSKNL